MLLEKVCICYCGFIAAEGSSVRIPVVMSFVTQSNQPGSQQSCAFTQQSTLFKRIFIGCTG